MSREEDINAALALIDDAFRQDEIEERHNGRWGSVRGPSKILALGRDDYQYRAKLPEPREFWVYDGSGTLIIERDGPPDERMGYWIKVKEILE